MATTRAITVGDRVQGRWVLVPVDPGNLTDPARMILDLYDWDLRNIIDRSEFRDGPDLEALVNSAGYRVVTYLNALVSEAN